jgi:hypothetical protein
MTSHFAGVWRGADTVLLGRNNYEGFFGYWPAVAADPNSAPRDRDMARRRGEGRVLADADRGPLAELPDLTRPRG